MISTIILVVIAIIMGIFVINFGRAQIEEAAECMANPGMDVVRINSVEQFCYDTEKEKIFFIVENGNLVDLNGVFVRIIGEKDIFEQDIDKDMPKKGTIMKFLPYSKSDYGNIRQIKIIPKIKLDSGKDVFCDDFSITKNFIRDCNI